MDEPTLRDVAKLAELSVGTVSKYINGGAVSSKNAKLIGNAIKELNYVPSPLARNLAKGKSYSILLYIMVETPIVASTWLHELPIIQGVNDAVKGSGYSVQIEIASYDKTKENLVVINDYSARKRADAIIILSPWQISKEIIDLLESKNFPYVMIGRSDEVNSSNSIQYENERPIIDIVHHQYEHGHREFGMISGFKLQLDMQLREDGFRQALKDLNIDLREDRIKYGDYSFSSGYHLTLDMLSSDPYPSTVICGNDYMAAGAIKAINMRGLKVPNDISVSGFDCTVIAEATSPTITTVKVASYETGVKAAKELMKKIKNPGYTIGHTILKSQIIYNESTGPFLK